MSQAPQPQHRAGEVGHVPFRSDRLSFSGQAWYFLIRGGHPQGPYTNAEEARQALQRYMETLAHLHKAFEQPTEDDHHHMIERRQRPRSQH